MKKKGSKIARDIEEELRRKEEILKLVELEKKHKKKVGVNSEYRCNNKQTTDGD